MALEFLAQALCIPLWLIITGGVTPPRNPHGIQLDADGARGAARYDNLDERDEAPLVLNGNGNIQHDPEQGDDAGGGAGEDDVPMLRAEGEEEEQEGEQEGNYCYLSTFEEGFRSKTF